MEKSLVDGVSIREEELKRSIAVGSRSFIENVKTLLGFRAKGRDVIEGSQWYHLREGTAHYHAFFGAGNNDIGPENTYLWDIQDE
jgi:hypothetical protein